MLSENIHGPDGSARICSVLADPFDRPARVFCAVPGYDSGMVGSTAVFGHGRTLFPLLSSWLCTSR